MLSFRNWLSCPHNCDSVSFIYLKLSGIITKLYFSRHAGLKLNLFIEQSQYIPELSHTAGARVIIHDQGQIPFPNNEGYSVLPSRSTSFAIRRVSIHCVALN